MKVFILTIAGHLFCLMGGGGRRGHDRMVVGFI